MSASRSLPGFACVLLCVACFGCGSQEAVIHQSKNVNLSQLKMAIFKYAESKQAKPEDPLVWPDTLDEVFQFHGGADKFADFMKNPLTGDEPGYEYVKPDGAASPETTVILYQLRDGERDTTLHVCYADGTIRAYGSKK